MKSSNFFQTVEPRSRNLTNRKILAILPICLFLTQAVFAASGTVYYNDTLQQIGGFGAAIYDGSANLEGRSYKEEVYDYMFRDLGLDVLRIRNAYSIDSGYVTATGSMVREANERSVAMGRAIPKIELVPWSPPNSLKSNGQQAGGTLIGGPSNYDYPGLANWWANSLTASNGWGSVGIHPTYISIQNEPDWSATYESCRYDPTENSSYAGYDQALEAVYNEVYARLGSNMPKMIGPESTGSAAGESYIDAFINQNHVYAYSFHLYEGTDTWNNPDNALSQMESFYAAYYGIKPLIMTEFVHLNDDPSFDDAWKLAWIIHNGLYHMGLYEYYHWTLFRATGTGGLINVTSSSSYIVRDMYWYLKHYAYYTDPNWYLVNVTTNPNTNMRMSAFKNAANNKLAVVILNKSATAETLTLTLDGCAQTASAVYRSSETEHWASMGTFSNPVSLPAYSIVTISFDVTAGPTNSLTCSSTAGGDVTTPGEGAFQYSPGSYAAIVATADQYYHFVNWTGTAVTAGKVADPDAASTTVLMDANYTVVANFEANPPDTTPPTPNPSTWATVPTATGPSTITMTASTASDTESPPVQYYFECTNDGSKSSAWQSSTTYVATGLTPSTQYSFRIQARDSAPTPNVTGWSSTLAATTEPPSTDVEILGSWVTGTTHAKEAGYNRALIFIAHEESTTGNPYLSSVTYGGQTMTKIIEVNAVSGYGNYTAAFILNETGIAAATGNPPSFTPTWSGTTSTVAYASVFLQNVDQMGLVGDSDKNSTTSSTPNPITTPALVTNDGDMVVVGVTCGNNGNYSLNNGFTEGADQSVGTNGLTGAAGHKSATGAAETPSATYNTGPNRQAIIGFVIQAAAGAPVSRTLTTSAGTGGTVTTPGIGNYDYNDGTNASIVASANANYHFVNWTGSAVTAGKVANPNAASTTVLMDANYTVQANFALDQRSLTTSATTGGTVSTPGIGTYWYDHGTNANITASADTGYHFVNWSGSAVTAGKVANPDSSSTTALMDANYTVQANFTIDQFTITASAGSNGTIDPSGAIIKNYGSSQCFIATPGTGYAVDTWYLDGGPVQTGGSTYCLNDITANHTVTVTFKLLTYTITASAGANGTVAPTSIVVDYGSSQDFTATPSGGFDVNEWFLDGAPAQIGGTTYTLTNITAEHTVLVTFKSIISSFSISGYVKNGCNVPIEGVVVDADNGAGQDNTDSAGYYEIWVENGWSGMITPTKQNHTFAPVSRSYTNVQADAANQNYTANNVYDLDCDGLIGFGDVYEFAGNWLLTGPGVPADFTNNEIVDFLDFAEFGAVWGNN